MFFAAWSYSFDVPLFLFNMVLGSEMSIPPLLQTLHNDEAVQAGLLVLVLGQRRGKREISWQAEDKPCQP